MNFKPRTKLLTISLLCSGRPETTERCLKSVMPLRKNLDAEIIVIDTGCDKETRAIIDNYADEVYEFTWCNDFAKARDYEVETSNGRWLLYLDDDEFFLDTTNILDFFKSGTYKKYKLGGYIQRNFLDYENKEWADTRVIRMTAVRPETRFNGKVHEYILPVEGPTIFLDDAVGHYGYIFKSLEENRKHSERNIPLLKEMIIDEPDEPRWPYQLAQEYKATQRQRELLELCDEYIKKMHEGNPVEEIYYNNFIAGKAFAYEQMNDIENLAKLYEETMANPRISNFGRARVACYAVRIFYMNNQYEKSMEAGENFLTCLNKVVDVEVDKIYQGGIFLDDTFDETHINHAYAYLIASGLRLNDLGPLHHYYKKITWESTVLRLSRGFICDLITAGANRGYEKAISGALNKFFIKHGLKVVLFKEIGNLSYKAFDEEQLKRLKENFKNSKNEAELVAFVDARIAEKRLDAFDEKTPFDDYTKELESYAKNNLVWWDLFNMDKRDEINENDYSEAVKISMNLKDFFQYKDTDYKKAFDILKKIAKKYPTMSRIINFYSRIYGDRIKIDLLRENDPNKFDEMYNLELAVREQIKSLEESGHGADASTTRGQLEGILMQTFGVKTLLK